MANTQGNIVACNLVLLEATKMPHDQSNHKVHLAVLIKTYRDSLYSTVSCV